MKKCLLGVISLLSLLGCQKDKDYLDQKKNPAFSFMDVIQFSDESDFYVLTSVATPDGDDFNEFSLDRGSAIIQGASGAEIFVGELTVAGINIPFVDNRFYSYSDTSFRPSNVSGQTINYTLAGVGFPSFSAPKYVPQQTSLNFDPPVDTRLSRTENLTIEWTPDPLLPENAMAGFLLFFSEGLDENPIPTVQKIYQVLDSDGSLTISGSDFSVFSECSGIHIMFLRGYNQTETIEGKVVDFRFIGHTYSGFRFQN
ncbi:MAG: hypothetical protein LAT76_09720 [Schleiferiaceae bacterium]|nr:hypothetical protein [Schleiferiaceae bacterium]